MSVEPNRAATTAHLEMLHTHAKATGADGVLVLVGYGEDPSTGKKLPSRIKPFPLGDVTRMVDQAMEWTVLLHLNVYVAPAVMRPDLPAGSRGGKKDIVQVFALVADYDDDEAGNWASRVPIAPSYILETSPDRFQTGFLLDPMDCAQAEALAKRLQVTAQCDAGTGDIAHVWRIDGTLNWPNKKKAKAGRSLAPVLVRTAPGGTGAVVRGLETVLRRLDENKKESDRKTENGSQRITVDDETQLALMFTSKNGAKIRKLWEDDWSDDYPSQSEADSALCCYLAFWFGRDPERMDRVFRQSKLMREKWDEPRVESTYGADCIANACATVTETYQEAADAAVLELNKQYAVVWMGGDCVILREHLAPDTGLFDVSFCTKAGLKLFHANEAKVNPDHWLKHPKRRTYHGLIFQPGRTSCDPSLYNLWQGFAVEPKQGDCSLYLEHLRYNICRGNKEHYTYLLAWMANIVQTPGTRPGIAIVLRGKQGTGKGVFAKGFGYLFKPHFAHITNSHQLVGRFNALLKKAVVVFADEAFWAGDKQAEGTLNALITEETHNIEPKGIDPFSVKNFMHLIVASNHDWVIPAASEARRWLVLDVSDTRMQDHAYFKAIDTQMKNGGSAALLYKLLHYDGSGMDLWTVPKTAALGDQKVHSMTPVEKFWFGCLKAGSQIGERLTREGYYPDKGWETEVCASELYDTYIRRSQQAGVTRRAMEMDLADALKKWVPGLEKVKVRAERTEGQIQVRGWRIPPLRDCRTAFDQYMNWTYKWEDEPLDECQMAFNWTYNWETTKDDL